MGPIIGAAEAAGRAETRGVIPLPGTAGLEEAEEVLLIIWSVLTEQAEWVSIMVEQEHLAQEIMEGMEVQILGEVVAAVAIQYLV